MRFKIFSKYTFHIFVYILLELPQNRDEFGRTKNIGASTSL